MRWIKASDVGENRIQEKYCGRVLKGETISGYGQFSYYAKEWRDENFIPIPEELMLEILDETPSESEAVEFAEWLVKRKVSPVGDGLWEDMGDAGDGGCPVRNTKQLYQIFKQQP